MSITHLKEVVLCLRFITFSLDCLQRLIDKSNLEAWEELDLTDQAAYLPIRCLEICSVSDLGIETVSAIRNHKSSLIIDSSDSCKDTDEV